jgi:hypothetical protein
MPLPYRRTTGLALSLIALALTNIDASGDGPRNPAAEAATGDTDAMLAVVQDGLRCLRAKGFQPGAPQVIGANVVTPDWNPDPDSPAGRATHECFFPAP